MATLEEIVVQLTAETSQLRAELKNATNAVSQSTDKMDKALSDFSSSSKKNLTFTQQALATMSGFIGSQAVLGAFGLLKDAAGEAWSAFLEGVDAAQAEEQALTRLANSMVLAGTATSTSMKDLSDFAGAMEMTTGVADDVVASNLALLSSMTKLDSEGLKRAQQAAIDLSSAYNIDLETATRVVGKAIEGNVDGLKKYGIEVRASADKTQQFSNVMQGLAGVQGSAAANMRTFQGGVLGLKNSFGNFVEEIAKAVTGNAVLIAALGEAAKIFQELTGAAQSNGSALREGIAKAFLFIADSVVVALEVLDVLWRTMKAGILSVAQPLVTLVDTFKYVLAASQMNAKGMDEAFNNSKAVAEEFNDTVGNTGGLSKLADVVARVRDAGAQAFDQLGTSAATAAPSIQGVTGAVRELTEAQKAHQEVIQSFAEGLASQTQALNSELEFRRELMTVNAGQELEAQVALQDQKMALLQEQFAAENQALIDARAQNLITEQQYQDAKTALDRKQQLDQAKATADRKKAEDAYNKERIQNLQSSFGTIATLSSSGNKELAAIGKAAAIATATMDGYVAVQKAFAFGGPFGFALAAAVGAATAANVAKIAGVGLKSGIDSVPGIGNQDNFPAVLAPGERVLTADQNQDLTNFLRKQDGGAGGGGGGGSVTINVNIAPGTGITAEQTANIVEAMNSYFANGGMKLLGATT